MPNQLEGGGPAGDFAGGGVLGLSCRSRPNVESMTVPADSTLRVVNRTGHSARLRLGGTAKGTVPDNGSTEVVFRRGTTAVLLSPNCALGDQSIPLLVTATPTNPAAMPDPIPAPSDPADPVATPTDSPSATAGGSTLPDSAGPATTPERPATIAADRPGAVRTTTIRPGTVAAASMAAAATPQGGSAPRIKARTVRGTGAASPAFSGMPPGDEKAIVSGVPEMPLSQATEVGPAAAGGARHGRRRGGAGGGDATDAGDRSDRPAGADLDRLCDRRAAGAIRAFVSQRASRTTIA